MEFIVAVDTALAIGKGGKLLYHVPEDLAFFRRSTVGHIVVMGRRTFESLPGRKALPDRRNVVLSANPDFAVPGVVVLRNLEELASFLYQHSEEKVFVMGGASLYQRLLPHCEGGYMTHLEATAKEPDRFFPDIQNHPNWSCEGIVHDVRSSVIPFQVRYYKNHDVLPLEVAP